MAWLALGWVVIFWRLGYLGLLDPDEAHYAELTREMMRSGSWFVPLLDGTPFIDKPVFFHWLQAAAIALFGDSEWALRIPSALAAAGLVAIVWWSARRLRLPDAEAAAAMFLTLPATFALASVGVFDMTFGLCLFSALACLVIGAQDARPRLQFAGFVALTFAVMIKGPVAIALIVLFASVAWCVPQTRPLMRRVRWISGLAFVGVAAVPWFAWMAVSFGDRFLRDYLLAGNLWYLTRPAEFSTRTSDTFFYARTFLGAFFPWSLIAVAGGVDQWRASRRGAQTAPTTVLLWLWVGVILVLFTVARFKLDTYIYPAAPACALLSALAWHHAATDRSRIVTRVVALLIASVLVVGGLVAGLALLQINLGIGAKVVLLPAAFVVGGILMLRRYAHWRVAIPPRPQVLIATLVSAIAIVVQLGFPLLETSRPTRILGQWIAHHSTGDMPVGAYGLEDWNASIRYYSERSVRRLENGLEVRDFFAQSPDAKVLMLSTDFDALRQDGLPIESVAARPAIVGRTGKVFRRQIWGQLVVATRQDYAMTLARSDFDIQ